MSDDFVTDFALSAYREDGIWQVTPVPAAAAADIDRLIHVLHQSPGDTGAVGMVSVSEDFFLLVRVSGDETRLLLSDATAAFDSPLAAQVLARLDLPLPSGDEIDDVQPAGDLEILADLGLHPLALSEICTDEDLWSDEMLGRIAEQLGFAGQFDTAVDFAV